MNGRLEVSVVGSRVVRLAFTPPVAAKVLPGPDGPRLMMIGSAAGLLRGDSVVISVDLAAGARLTVGSAAATVAHPCHRGERTSVEVTCRVGAGARLAWLPEPLIACRGCDHHGRVRLALAAGAVVTWVDTVTLGRTGEVAGRLDQRLDAELEGRPLLRDAFRASGDLPGWNGPAVVAGFRHLASAMLLGRRLPEADAPPGALQLAGPGTLVRLLASRGDELARQLGTVVPLLLEQADPLPVPDALTA